METIERKIEKLLDENEYEDYDKRVFLYELQMAHRMRLIDADISQGILENLHSKILYTTTKSTIQKKKPLSKTKTLFGLLEQLI